MIQNVLHILPNGLIRPHSSRLRRFTGVLHVIQGLAKSVYAGTGFMLPTTVTSHDDSIL